MASFTLVRELLDLQRDNGNKRLLLGLYSASDSNGDDESARRYLALSEQEKSGDDWKSTRKGITVRRGEIAQVIAALQSADFDSKPDGKSLSPQEYAALYCDWG